MAEAPIWKGAVLVLAGAGLEIDAVDLVECQDFFGGGFHNGHHPARQRVGRGWLRGDQGLREGLVFQWETGFV
jgi:hypothetical protein